VKGEDDKGEGDLFAEKGYAGLEVDWAGLGRLGLDWRKVWLGWKGEPAGLS
jgi:hypothetical protein